MSALNKSLLSVGWNCYLCNLMLGSSGRCSRLHHRCQETASYPMLVTEWSVLARCVAMSAVLCTVKGLRGVLAFVNHGFKVLHANTVDPVARLCVDYHSVQKNAMQGETLAGGSSPAIPSLGYTQHSTVHSICVLLHPQLLPVLLPPCIPPSPAALSSSIAFPTSLPTSTPSLPPLRC